jgi:hypothetical protein
MPFMTLLLSTLLSHHMDAVLHFVRAMKWKIAATITGATTDIITHRRVTHESLLDFHRRYSHACRGRLHRHTK